MLKGYIPGLLFHSVEREWSPNPLWQGLKKRDTIVWMRYKGCPKIILVFSNLCVPYITKGTSIMGGTDENLKVWISVSFKLHSSDIQVTLYSEQIMITKCTLWGVQTKI